MAGSGSLKLFSCGKITIIIIMPIMMITILVIVIVIIIIIIITTLNNNRERASQVPTAERGPAAGVFPRGAGDWLT